MKKALTRFIVRFIRPLWSQPIKAAYWIKYWILIRWNPIMTVKYLTNRNAWEAIRTLDGLCEYFKKQYLYKSDGFGGTIIAGALDHDNSLLEFLASGGDCDDAARWSAKKLQAMGYNATRWAFVCPDIRNNHFDTVIEPSPNIQKDAGWNYRRLFNYGNITSILTTNEIEVMNAIFGNKNGYFDAFPVGE